MRHLLKTMVVALLLLVLSGCAGVSGGTQMNPYRDLRGNVYESFHSTIQDEGIKKYLASADLGSMSADRKLEVVLLKELALASEESDLDTAFDRIWKEHKEVRDLIGKKDKGEQFIYPLAEMYYLLSVPRSPDWQDKMAENLYDETLRNVEPQKISGYALHFYTLALLKNGRCAAAMPYLERLDDFTADGVYIADLTMALDCTIASADYAIASHVMAMVCERSITGGVKFPAREMESAVLKFKKVGKLGEARKTLLPIIRTHPSLQGMSFAQLLKKPEKTASQGVPSVDVVPKNNTGHNVLSKTKADFVARKSRKEGTVRVEVQVIKAGHESDYIDPALGDVGNDLRKTLSFSSFTLVSDKTLSLKLEERGEFGLPNDNIVHVVPHKISPDKSRLEVRILQGGKEVFNTLVESRNGGVTIIGGPQVYDGTLLLRLTIFIVTIDAESKNPCVEEKSGKVLV